MWAPGRMSRTSSMHSLARSVTSNSGSSFEDGLREKEFSFPSQVEMWHPGRKSESAISVEFQRPESIISLQEPPSRRDSISTDDSHLTLALEVPEDEMDPKTPTVLKKTVDLESRTSTIAFDQPAEPAGPLEQLLLSALAKVSRMEREQPTIMAEDYKQLQDRIADLEAENKAWQKRHEAVFALRDEDVANLIKVRGLLAAERREHAAMRKLRDDDLHNVLELREKLAHTTWTKPEKPRSATPERGRAGTISARQSRAEGNDLWQAAKTAAMEQRVLELELELEKANKELKAQTATGGGMSRFETMFEDSLRYREKMATKVQQLRSEKEALQKDSARLEDRNAELEAIVERLQRSLGLQQC